MSNTRILYLFTRTPLHVGAGASVGAIDQPVQRERHTGFPIIPASSLKGTFADAWNGGLLVEQNDKGQEKNLTEPKDEEAIFDTGGNSKLDLSGQIVLEEYTFKSANTGTGLAKLGGTLAALLVDELVWAEVKDRLVILSNGMMSFFAQNACEVAQHVRISDETGTAEGGALFNQENVPGETLFYSVIRFFQGRGETFKEKTPDQAVKAFQGHGGQSGDPQRTPGVRNGSVFQFGGDASTGLGYCTAQLAVPCQPL